MRRAVAQGMSLGNGGTLREPRRPANDRSRHRRGTQRTATRSTGWLEPMRMTIPPDEKPLAAAGRISGMTGRTALIREGRRAPIPRESAPRSWPIRRCGSTICDKANVGWRKRSTPGARSRTRRCRANSRAQARSAATRSCRRCATSRRRRSRPATRRWRSSSGAGRWRTGSAARTPACRRRSRSTERSGRGRAIGYSRAPRARRSSRSARGMEGAPGRDRRSGSGRAQARHGFRSSSARLYRDGRSAFAAATCAFEGAGCLRRFAPPAPTACLRRDEREPAASIRSRSSER